MKKQIYQVSCDWCGANITDSNYLSIRLYSPDTNVIPLYKGRDSFDYCVRCAPKVVELMDKDSSVNKAEKPVKIRTTNDGECIGQCPRCGLEVFDGWCGKDDRCKNCGQKLKW